MTPSPSESPSWSALVASTARLIQETNEAAIGGVLVEEIAALLSASDVRLGLAETDSACWVLRHAIGPAAKHLGRRYPCEEGLIGHTISQREALCIERLHEHPLVTIEDNITGLGTVVTVPLRYGSEVLGALLAARPPGMPPLTPNHERAAQVLCDLAGARLGAVPPAATALRARAQELAVLDPVWRPRPEEAGDFVIITSARDRPFLDVDDAACRILGYPRETLLQFSIGNIIPLPPGAENVDTLAGVREQMVRGIPVTYDTIVRRCDGTLIPVRMTIQRVPGLENPVYRVTFSDLSREQGAQARATEAEKQRVLQEVGSAIAHELNTPLAVILGNIEIACEEFPDAALQDLLRPVQEAAERIAGTVKRLQQFAKLIVPSGWASVDLSQLVSQVVEQTRPLWEAGPQAIGHPIALELHVVPVPLVRAHSIELQDAVRELISNAVLAQPEGGTITISTGADDHWVWVSVRDTGVGMTDEVRQRCIDPFFTTRRPAAMGLGLNRVYHTVLQHRGRLQIESRPGAGTCVTISLPVVPEASTAAVVRGTGEARPT